MPKSQESPTPSRPESTIPGDDSVTFGQGESTANGEPARAEDEKGGARAQLQDDTSLPATVLETLKREGIDPGDPTVRATARVISAWYHFSGPLPPADELAAYDDVRPGIVNQVIGWADQQITHRINREAVASSRAQDRLVA